MKKWMTEERVELIVAILLAITALLVAWATWIGSLHGGNQATNYTKSNNLSSEGNAEFNEASQLYMQDMLTWNSIMDYRFDVELALAKGDTESADLIEEKIDLLIADNCSEEMQAAIEWADEQGLTPFDKEGFVDSYYENALAKLDESQTLLEQGMKDNLCGDRYGLVTVIYSLVLFLLGIVGVFKRLPNRRLMLVVSLVLLIVTTVFMLTIPMPTGFDFFSYFKG